jgi:aspartate/methionine/tyrosine aminotransferase
LTFSVVKGAEVLSAIARRALSIERSPLYSILEIAKGLEDVIYLNWGRPDLDTPKHVVEAAKKALDEGYTQYAPDRGELELRMLIAEDLKRELNVDYDPEREIQVTNGGQAGLYVALASIVNPGDEVIILSPFYPPYLVDVKLSEGTPVFVELKEENDFNPNPSEIEQKVTGRTKAIIILSPNNPTGAVYSKECLEGIAEIAKKHGLIVISDECYWKIVYDEAKHVSIASLPGMRERENNNS